MAAKTRVFGHLIEHDAGDWSRVVTEDGVTIGRIRKVERGWQYAGPQVWPRPRALVWPSRQVAVWELICENEQAGLSKETPVSEDAPTVRCDMESDGYHVHVYSVYGEIGDGRSGRFRIEHHLHAWMDEHKQLYPHVKDVDASTLRHDLLGYWDTVEEAWAAMKVTGDIPEVSCRD